jgi:hypothetical protein
VAWTGRRGKRMGNDASTPTAEHRVHLNNNQPSVLLLSVAIEGKAGQRKPIMPYLCGKPRWAVHERASYGLSSFDASGAKPVDQQ